MSLEDRSPENARMGKLLDVIPRFVGASRVEAARQAECERCAQVGEDYLKSLSVWTAADDHGPPPREKLAVTAAIQEVVRRIRKRNEARR